MRPMLIWLVALALLSGCQRAQAAPSQPLPFVDNPDPTLCGIPEPDERTGTVTGEYDGKLVQPVVYLYNSHLRSEIVGQLYPGTRVQIELSQSNPALNYYFVRSLGVSPTQAGWIPAPFLEIEKHYGD